MRFDNGLPLPDDARPAAAFVLPFTAFMSPAPAESPSAKHRLSAASCQRSARLFNLLAIASTVLAASLFGLGMLIGDRKLAFLPMAMSLPPVMIWLAASIFVYASIAHHPDLTVRHYNKWAGYRYYAVVGAMTIFANDLAHLPTGWLGVWGLFILALVPWAAYDVWKAGGEDWRDIEVNEEAQP
jgi:hypothetical protein